MSRLVGARDEQGVSLIELMIYMSLLVIVSILAGSILISGLRGQRDISNVGSATSQAQLITSSVEAGIRSASTFDVSTTTVGQRLIARVGTFTAAGTATWQCRAWLFTTDKRLLTLSSTSGTVAAPANLAAAVSGWTLLASNVSIAAGSSALFTESGTAPKSILTIAAQVGVAGGTGNPAIVQTQVTQLALPTTAGTGPATCS